MASIDTWLMVLTMINVIETSRRADEQTSRAMLKRRTVGNISITNKFEMQRRGLGEASLKYDR